MRCVFLIKFDVTCTFYILTLLVHRVVQQDFRIAITTITTGTVPATNSDGEDIYALQTLPVNLTALLANTDSPFFRSRYTNFTNYPTGLVQLNATRFANYADRRIYVWSASSFRLVKILETSPVEIQNIAAMPSRKSDLLVVANPNGLFIVNITSGEKLAENNHTDKFKLETNLLVGLADGVHFISTRFTSQNNGVFVWRFTNASSITLAQFIDVDVTRLDGVTSIAPYFDSRRVMFAFSKLSNVVYIYKMNSDTTATATSEVFSLVKVIRGNENWPGLLDISWLAIYMRLDIIDSNVSNLDQYKDLLVSANSDGSVRVWNVSSNGTVMHALDACEAKSRLDFVEIVDLPSASLVFNSTGPSGKTFVIVAACNGNGLTSSKIKLFSYEVTSGFEFIDEIKQFYSNQTFNSVSSLLTLRVVSQGKFSVEYKFLKNLLCTCNFSFNQVTVPSNDTNKVDENAEQLVEIITIMGICALSLSAFILIIAVIKRSSILNKVEPISIAQKRVSNAFSLNDEVGYLHS
jgi:WD40 repeat protein